MCRHPPSLPEPSTSLLSKILPEPRRDERFN
jgi:hypothetical protein